MKKSITISELDRIIEISKMDWKAEKISNEFFKIISYFDLKKINKSNNELFNEKLQKVCKIYEYFRINGLFAIKDFYKCSPKELNDKIERLEVMYNTFQSDMSDDEKAEVIFEFYSDVNSLKYDYSIIVKYGVTDKRLLKFRTILLKYYDILDSFVSFENNIKLKNNALYRNSIKKHLEQTKYLDNYLYAKYVVELFINDDSLSRNDFYQKLSIDNKTFNYCVGLIKFLDIKLYKEYEQTMLDNSLNRNNRIKNNINEIVNRINNDPTFNILEFYRLVPFKEYEYNFIPYLLSFVINNYGLGSLEHCTIINYIYQNGITNTVYISEETYNNKSLIINGTMITPYIVNIIFRYMKINDLPFISNVYDIVIRMYINNQIDVSNLIQKEQSLEQQSKLLKYKNPYELV